MTRRDIISCTLLLCACTSVGAAAYLYGLGRGYDAGVVAAADALMSGASFEKAHVVCAPGTESILACLKSYYASLEAVKRGDAVSGSVTWDSATDNAGVDNYVRMRQLQKDWDDLLAHIAKCGKP